MAIADSRFIARSHAHRLLFPPMDVTVIIVTYNSAASIHDCLNSVAAQKGLRLETILIDNASGDDTVAQIREFPNVRLIVNQENIGFGLANNQAFKTSQGRFIYLLNPDAQ